MRLGDAPNSARIIGTGSYVPDRVVTNEELEQTVPGVDAEWTFKRLGIRERRVVAPGQSTGDLAFEAGRSAIANAGLVASDIDLVIVATTTPHRIAPSTACYVQARLGELECAAFDLAAVCSGFIYGLSVAHQFVSTGLYRHALIVGADTFSTITDWNRRDCVFFGDAAGAVVIGPCPVGEGILSWDLGASGSGRDAWTVPAGGSEQPTSTESLEGGLHFWQMDGKAVYDMAVSRIPATVSKSLDRARLALADVDHVVPHQPGIGVLQHSAEIMGIPFDKFHTNMASYANTSAATIPLVLDGIAQRGDVLRRGEVLAMLAVGGGLDMGICDRQVGTLKTRLQSRPRRAAL